MSDRPVEKIPLPKDEVNSSLFCCFPTRSWSGKRINGYQVVEKSFDERRKIFILGVGNTDKESYQIPPCKKGLHYGFEDLKDEMVNVCRVVKC